MQVRALVLALMLAGGCCGSAALGTPCPVPPGAGGTVGVASPSLECRSRLCLVPAGVCTVECSTDDECGMVGLNCRGQAVCASVAGYPRAVCRCVALPD